MCGAHATRMRLFSLVLLTSSLALYTACAAALADDEIENSGAAQSASGRPDDEIDDNVTDDGCKVVEVLEKGVRMCKGTRFGKSVGTIRKDSVPVPCTILDNSCDGNFDLVYACDVNWVSAGKTKSCRAFQNGVAVGDLKKADGTPYTEDECNTLQGVMDQTQPACTPMYAALLNR
jgi:hypothetical protein